MQLLTFIALIRLTSLPTEDPDQEFSNLDWVLLGWALSVIASIGFTTVALACVRVHFYGVLTVAALFGQVLSAIWLITRLQNHTNWCTALIALVLPVEFVLCRWVLPKPRKEQKGQPMWVRSDGRGQF